MLAMPTRTLLALALATAALAGCGGDEDDPAATTEPPATTQAAPPAATTEAEPPSKPRRERRTLADCLRSAPGVDEVLEKGADNEDARYFRELVGGRVRAFAITVEGQTAEIDAFVFESQADAKKAAPGAGGSGLEASVHGSAVLVAPASAETGAIASCLEAG